MQLLLDRGAKKNIVNGEGWAALQLAAYQGRSEVVRVLLKSGVWAVDYATQDLAGALYLATSGNGTAHTVELLLDAGAGVDHRSTRRNTPLHIALHNAATTNKLDVIKLLLSCCADSILGRAQFYSFVAQNKGHKEAAALLAEDVERRWRTRTQKIWIVFSLFCLFLTLIVFRWGHERSARDLAATPRTLRENVALASLAAAPLVVPYLERLNGPLLPEQKAMLASVLCRTTHQPHGRSPTCPRARPA